MAPTDVLPSARIPKPLPIPARSALKAPPPRTPGCHARRSGACHHERERELTRLLVCVVRHHRHAQPIERLPRLPKHEAHIPPQLADGRDRHGRPAPKGSSAEAQTAPAVGLRRPNHPRIFVSIEIEAVFGAGVKQPRAASLHAQDGRLRRGWGGGEDQDRALRPPRPPPLPPRPPTARNHALFPFPVLPSGAGNPPPNAHQT